MLTTNHTAHDGHGWHEPRHGADFPTCGYCGSLPVDTLLALRDAGRIAHVDRSVDWKYGWPHKIYVDVIPADPSTLHWLGGTAGGPTQTPDQLRAGGYTPVAELTDAERAACEAGRIDLSTYQGVRVGPRAVLHAKFYTAHCALDDGVTDEQRQAIAAITGYLFEPADGGRISWRTASL